MIMMGEKLIYIEKTIAACPLSIANQYGLQSHPQNHVKLNKPFPLLFLQTAKEYKIAFFKWFALFKKFIVS